MKKNVIIIICIAVAILALAAVIFVRCDDSNSLQTPESGFVDPRTGIEYIAVTPQGLYPDIPYDSEDEGNDPDVYVTVGDYNYYVVTFQFPRNYLCYEQGGNYFLVRNVDVAEPTLAEFNAVNAAIHVGNNPNAIDWFNGDYEYLSDYEKEKVSEENYQGETALCRQITEALTNGESVDLPLLDADIETLYRIRLFSNDYEGLYYQIPVFTYNGKHYLSDRSTGKIVECPRDVAYRIMGTE